jgi:molybdopterin molybdotransferase
MGRIALEAALELVLSKAAPITETQCLPLREALGFVAGEAVFAPRDDPPFNKSPLDGFALRSADTAEASETEPVRLRIAGTLYAGAVHGTPLLSGEALRLMTGSPMPEGSDAMLPKEDVQEDGDEALISRAVKKHENYIFQGEGIQRGQLLVGQDERLNFARLGILACMGLDTVRVFRPLKIGILCTGDELVQPGKPLPPGKIYNNNGVLLPARLEELGFHTKILPAMADEAQEVAAAIAASMDDLDLLITTGAVSVGDKDIMRPVFDLLGAETLFWRMDFRPGGTMLCGMYRGKLLLCLSGNPSSAMIGLELLVRPVLAKLSKRSDLGVKRLQCRLKEPCSKAGGVRRLVRARLESDVSGALPLISFPENRSSSRLFALRDSNCFVDIPAGSGALPEGSIVAALQFSGAGQT